MSIESCYLIDFPVVPEPRGDLTFMEGDRHLPFPIARVYYLYDVPAGACRGGHAHKQLEQVIIAVTGSFTARLNDGRATSTVHLTKPHQGLYITRMVWRDLTDFTAGAVCLVMASRPYEEEDYFRNYEEFLAAVNRQGG